MLVLGLVHPGLGISRDNRWRSSMQIEGGQIEGGHMKVTGWIARAELDMTESRNCGGYTFFRRGVGGILAGPVAGCPHCPL